MTTSELDIFSQKQLVQSRMRYADLFDFAPIGYATLNALGYIEEVNLASARLLGGTPHQFIGRKFEELVTPDDRLTFREHIERCRMSGQRIQTELHLISSSGDPISVELYTAAGLEMERGDLEFRCALINITQRKQAEEALRRSEIELELRAKHHFLSEASAVFSASLDYATVLENIGRMSIPRLADCCVIDVVNADGMLKREAAAHLDRQKEPLLWELGILPSDRNDMFGKAKVIRTSRSELYADINDSLLSALARSPDHLRILRELHFRSFMCVPMIVRGNVIGAVGFMRVREDRPYSLFDLALAEEYTERAAMAIDNAMLYAKEQAANRLKDEFLAIVSHELRTPLTPILGAMYHLKSIRPGDPETQAMAGIVEKNARAQARLIDELLDVSRVATGKFELDRRIAEIADIVEAAVNVVRPAAEARGIRIDVSAVSARIECDAARIQQALVNLISNAIKFSNSGTVIRVRAERRLSVIRIAVSDEGKGIAPDFLPHVFEPFRQADDFITRSHAGLGLGLSIVYHIVRQHGGTIKAESDGEGKGSTFSMELPYHSESSDA